MATCLVERSGGTRLCSAFVRRKLHALGCPFRLDKQELNWEAVRDIVVWLEEEKIRLYPRRRRIPLRTVDNSAEWWSLMKQYCQDLEISLPQAISRNSATVSLQSLNSLLGSVTSVAVGDVYEDAVEADAVALGPPKQALKAESEEDGRLVCLNARSANRRKKLHAAIEPFLALLQLPPLRGSEAGDLETVSAFRAVAARLQSSSTSCTAETERLVFPSDKDLDRIANRVLVALPAVQWCDGQFLSRFLLGLRTLHVGSMRDTHERLDTVVEALQMLIGDPVTDSKLGKVGV